MEEKRRRHFWTKEEWVWPFCHRLLFFLQVPRRRTPLVPGRPGVAPGAMTLSSGPIQPDATGSRPLPGGARGGLRPGSPLELDASGFPPPVIREIPVQISMFVGPCLAPRRASNFLDRLGVPLRGKPQMFMLLARRAWVHLAVNDAGGDQQSSQPMHCR
jgi:hypothetical protein